MKGRMVGYELAPQAGCWMKQSAHAGPKPREGRIVWMRDGAQFSVVHCKMTETVMQADCGSRGDLGPWRMIAIERLIPISPRDCLNMSDSGKAILFDRAGTLTRNGTGMKTLEERINCDTRAGVPSEGARADQGELTSS
jgi:hypothetical protein